MVLGLHIGGCRLHSSPLTEVSKFRKQLIIKLNQELLTDDDLIHISNLQEEILKGRVNPLFHKGVVPCVLGTEAVALSIKVGILEIECELANNCCWKSLHPATTRQAIRYSFWN